MAESWWTDDNDDDDDGEDTSTNRGKPQLPNEARQHMRKIEKQLKTLLEENATLKKAQRKLSVSELIKAKGYDPEIAEFVPAEVEASEDALTKWLDTKAKFFAKQTGEGTNDASEGDTGSVDTNQGVAIPPEVMEALGLVAGVSSNAITPAKPADLMAQMKNANHEQLIEILRGQGATV